MRQKCVAALPLSLSLYIYIYLSLSIHLSIYLSLTHLNVHPDQPQRPDVEAPHVEGERDALALDGGGRLEGGHQPGPLLPGHALLAELGQVDEGEAAGHGVVGVHRRAAPPRAVAPNVLAPRIAERERERERELWVMRDGGMCAFLLIDLYAMALV